MGSVATAGVDRALAMQIEPACRGRKHLAHPIRRGGEVRRVGQLCHPLPAPPREVGDQDVLAEVQLRLVDDPPPARAGAPLAERPGELEVGFAKSGDYFFSTNVPST